VLAALFAAGCGSAGNSASPRPADQQAVRAYVGAIEPVRHRVDRLLSGTDPILRAYRDHQLSATAAQRRLRRIERRFVTYVDAVAAVRDVPPDLMAAQHAYAHTYVLDSAWCNGHFSGVGCDDRVLLGPDCFQGIPARGQIREFESARRIRLSFAMNVDPGGLARLVLQLQSDGPALPGTGAGSQLTFNSAPSCQPELSGGGEFFLRNHTKAVLIDRCCFCRRKLSSTGSFPCKCSLNIRLS